MKELFMCVLSLSLSGALTGLLILLMRPVTGKYFSRRWNYYIWLLVIARLVIPVYFESPFSFVMVRTAEDTPGRSASLSLSEAGLPEKPPAETALPSGPEADIPQSKAAAPEKISGMSEPAAKPSFLQPGNPASDARQGTALGILWLAGAGLSLSVKLKNYWSFTSAAKKGRIPVADDRVNHMAKDLMQRLSMRKNPVLYVSESVSVPITVGLIQPVILLPKESWLLKDLQMVLHHELIHVKRRDLWYKWIFQFLLCIHWFNPVLYLIGMKLNIDCELSCDEAVLTALSKEGQKAYGNVLIDTAQKNIKLSKNIPSTTLLERKEDLKMRLKGILHYKKPGGLRAVISLCLCGPILLLSACGSVQAGPDALPVRLSVDAADEYTSFSDQAAARYVSFWDTLGNALGDWMNDGLDGFLSRPVLANQKSQAWKAYDDDSLIAGKDVEDQWSMYHYTGGGQRIKCNGMYLNGTASVRIVNVKKECELKVDSAFELLDGRFKIVHVNPDGEVAVINETGEKGSAAIKMKAGRNVIKFVGQGAKIKNLLIEHPSLEGKNFESLYYSEQEERSKSLTAGIKEGEVDKDSLMELLYYLDDEVVSQGLALLLEQGVSLTDEELKNLIIYSDSDLSALYLGEAIKSGKAGQLDDEAIIDLAPYLGGERLKELLLAADGKISFELIKNCAPYLGSSGLEEVLEKYLKDGGELTFSQFDSISPYLGSSGAKKLDELSSLKPLKALD